MTDEELQQQLPGNAMAVEIARLREQNSRLIEEMRDRAEKVITLREMFDRVYSFSNEPGPWTERVLDKVYEERHELTRLRALLANIAIDLNDDPELTCVLCNGAPCEFSFTTQSAGTRAWYGIHRECRQRTREGTK